MCEREMAVEFSVQEKICVIFGVFMNLNKVPLNKVPDTFNFSLILLSTPIEKKVPDTFNSREKCQKK